MERDHFFQSPEISHRCGSQGIRKEKTLVESIFIGIPEAPPIAYSKILFPSSQNSPVAIATEVLRGWKTAIT